MKTRIISFDKFVNENSISEWNDNKEIQMIKVMYKFNDRGDTWYQVQNFELSPKGEKERKEWEDKINAQEPNYISAEMEFFADKNGHNSDHAADTLKKELRYKKVKK